MSSSISSTENGPLSASTSTNTSIISIMKPIQPNSVNFTRTISQSSEQTSSSPIILSNPSELSSLIASVQTSSNEKQDAQNNYIKIRDYILFEPVLSANESFSTAYNLKQSKFFYWKVDSDQFELNLVGFIVWKVGFNYILK